MIKRGISETLNLFTYAARTITLAEYAGRVLKHVQAGEIKEAEKLLLRVVKEGDTLVAGIKTGCFPKPNQYINVDDMVSFSKKYNIRS